MGKSVHTARCIDNHCSVDNHHHYDNDRTKDQVLHVVGKPTKSSNILAESSDPQGIPALLVAQVASQSASQHCCNDCALHHTRLVKEAMEVQRIDREESAVGKCSTQMFSHSASQHCSNRGDGVGWGGRQAQRGKLKGNRNTREDSENMQSQS